MEPVVASQGQGAGESYLPRSVHTITDRFSMSNTYLLVDERLVVVDPGSDRNVRLLQIYLEKILHRSFADVDLVVVTHLHIDHIAGVSLLKRLCSAPVAASAVIRQLRTVSQEQGGWHEVGQFAAKLLPGILHHLDLFPPAYEQLSSVIDLWLEDVTGLPGHPDWRVIASPGHTPESLCLYNPFTRELLCGDTVITIQGGAPLVRAGTDRRQLQETLRVLRGLQVNYLYPGHGRAIPGQRPLYNIDVEW